MRQMSLLDSFIKRQKNQSVQSMPKNTNKKQTQKDIFTIQKDIKKTQSHIKQAPMQNQKKQNKNRQNTLQMFSDDFAFNQNIPIEQDKRKKRKMDIQDDEDLPKISSKLQDEDEMDIEYNSNDKQKKRVGRPPSAKSIAKKAEQQRIKKGGIIQEPQQQQFKQVTPDWATPQGCRDANGRKPQDPKYDPTTLYIPPEAQKGFTQTMKQYWKTKSQNFDKIILFKLGKFYQMFYEDALVGNRCLDLKWMGNKMHVGFPQKCLQKYSYQFVKLGYKLVIVEQLQTPDQMKQRRQKDKKQGRKTQKALIRGVTQILTKGTMVSFMDQNQYLPNYLISVYKQQNLIAYALLEMGVNLIMVGVVSNLDQFKTVLFQTRPVELLYDPDNLTTEIIDLMKQNWLNMILTRLPNKNNAWHYMNSRTQIQALVNKGVFAMPSVIQSLQKQNSDEQKLIFSTLSGMFRYLRSLLKFDYIMSAVKFAFYQHQGSSLNMVIDSQALQHLEVFQTPLGVKDSLFNKIDRTSTKFGRRLLRRWVMQPLMDPVRINQRLDAIQDLYSVSLQRQKVSDLFGKLPDLQKIVNRLYHYSVKTIAEKAVYFEDVSSARLREFRQLIQHFNKSWQALQLLIKNKCIFKSERLKKLLTVQKTSKNQKQQQVQIQGLLPAIRNYLGQFQEYIKWQGDIPHPQKGLVQSYDLLQDQLTNAKFKLQDYLQQLKTQSRLNMLKFVHTKQKYQIQIPQDLQKKRPENMIFTSKRNGFSRYVTVQSRKLVANVEYIQSQIKQQMGMFVGYFFQQFRKNQKVWERYIAVLSQLDCLISLSIYSYQISGARPTFQQGHFFISGAKHPCLNLMDVIPNDIDMSSRVMLLTGPNMGGKSTLLRTTCLLVILAQAGCFVPADSYNCQIVDRIFTRIGASDKLEQGKSTFFIQMQETKSIIQKGTHKSLAIIDQLGRGTSTFDGMAIAYSVLQDIVQRIQCRCLFATHYHSLSKQFQGISEIALKMMSYMVVDDKLVFMYQLKDGRAEQSFGLNVAKVVKINNSIINIAQERAKMMQLQIQQKQITRKLKQAMKLMKS